jgi:hypothetical protein
VRREDTNQDSACCAECGRVRVTGACLSLSHVYTPVLSLSHVYTPVLSLSHVYMLMLSLSHVYTPVLSLSHVYTPVLSLGHVYTPLLSVCLTKCTKKKAWCAGGRALKLPLVWHIRSHIPIWHIRSHMPIPI